MSQASVRRIQKLDSMTVARIAAGEVVNRPANALKELIENALDAGSTSVQVTLRDGGLSLMQVSDDGMGIGQPDLDLLCERHATSKLNDALDLPTVSTFGFRGEALASICAIAKRVTVVTRTADSRCAFRAEYSDAGKLTSCVQQAAAQRSGTCVTVEQLFERAPNRARMFESANKRLAENEFAQCFEIMLRFALHFPKVGFVLRKAPDANSNRHVDEVALQTCPSPNATARDVVQRLFGAQFASQLTELECTPEKDISEICDFRFQCLMTSPNVSGNAPSTSTSSQSPVSGGNKMVNAVLRRTFYSFSVNNRLVDAFSSLRGVIRSAFAECASKLSDRNGSKAAMFVLGSLIITDRNLVDANVHPTKAEVRIATHEQAILANIDTAVRNCIGCARICDMPTTQPATATPREKPPRDDSDSAERDRDRDREKKRDTPNFLVRTDSKSRKLDEYLIPSSKTPSDSGCWQQTASALTNQVPFDVIRSTKRWREVRLRRLAELRDEVREGSSSELIGLLRDAVFVGVCDTERIVLQSGVRLLLGNLRRLSKEFLLQRFLMRFGNFDMVQFETPIAVDRLLAMAFDLDMASIGVDVDNDTESAKERRQSFVSRGVTTLRKHAEMLYDYFSVHLVDSEGRLPRREAQQEAEDAKLLLLAMPCVIDDARSAPDPNRLPALVKQLVQNVTWSDEKQCYRSVCSALGEFYCCKLPVDGKNASAISEEYCEYVEHVIFATMKQAVVDGQFLVPSSFQADRVFIELTSLPALYRVFERC